MSKLDSILDRVRRNPQEPFVAKQAIKDLVLEIIGPHESLTEEEIKGGRIYRVGDPQGDAVDRYKGELVKKVSEL